MRIIDSLTFGSIIVYSKGERPVSNVKQLTESVVTYLAQNYSVCSNASSLLEPKFLSLLYWQENASHVIKIILLVYFTFALFDAEGTDPSWLGHLASKRVWDEMYKFVPPIDICIAELKVNF